MQCGHQCPGLCGEACLGVEHCTQCALSSGQADTPQMNQVVDMVMQSTLAEHSPDESPLIRLQCGHVLTTATLDGMLELHKYYAREERKDGSVEWSDVLDVRTLPDNINKSAACPSCRVPIRNLHRYGRVLNRLQLEQAQLVFVIAARTQRAKQHTDQSALSLKLSQVESPMMQPHAPAPAAAGSAVAAIRARAADGHAQEEKQAVTDVELRRQLEQLYPQVEALVQRAHAQVQSAREKHPVQQVYNKERAFYNEQAQMAEATHALAHMCVSAAGAGVGAGVATSTPSAPSRPVIPAPQLIPPSSEPEQLALESLFHAQVLQLHALSLLDLKPILSQKQRQKLDQVELTSAAKEAGRVARQLEAVKQWMIHSSMIEATAQGWSQLNINSRSFGSERRALFARAQYYAQHLDDTVRLRKLAHLSPEQRTAFQAHFEQQYATLTALMPRLQQLSQEQSGTAQERSLVSHLLAELERLTRANTATFYTPVSDAERLEIYRAMERDVGAGNGAFGGHWYQCRNGHVYAIGERRARGRAECAQERRKGKGSGCVHALTHSLFPPVCCVSHVRGVCVCPRRVWRCHADFSLSGVWRGGRWEFTCTHSHQCTRSCIPRSSQWAASSVGLESSRTRAAHTESTLEPHSDTH